MKSKHIRLVKGESVIIDGKILKVGVITTIPNIRLKISSAFNEILVDDILKENVSVFYPRCFINYTREFPQLDYYYVGKLFISVEGLAEGETIDDIYIYYE